jgi:hypothetical protein
MPPTLPVTRDLTPACVASLAVAFGIAVSSAVGLTSGADGLYGDSPLVLISRGADVANLVLVLPTLLGSTWLARRGSLTALLLWPGALFYVLYAYVPYVVGAPFGVMFFVYVALVTLSAFSVIGIVASVDGREVRRRLAGAPARSVGGALIVIAVLAYAGLTAAAIGALGDPASEVGTRPLAVADWTVGTPVLLLGGALLLGRASLGYVTAPGLLLVSGLGGVVFAAGAVVDNLQASPQTEPAVIVVHLVIGAVSFGLLVFFLVGGARQVTAPTGISVVVPSSRQEGGQHV